MAREMKDSGIEWIGQIPVNWDIDKIGQIYSERKEKVSDLDYAPLSVTMKGILPQLSTAAKSDSHDDRKLLCEGDFAINSRSDRRGSCGISPCDGSVSLINIILQPKEKMNPNYYNWLFHTSMFADEFYKWGHGIVDDLWTTNWSDMKNIVIPSPSLDEQKRIADYLDVKVAKIDEAVIKTRSTIEEYKALKQSIISKAVTKGVRGDRLMKYSGIEWIGEIPEDWAVFSLGQLSFSMRNGYVGPTKDLFYDIGIKYIQSLHVKDGKIIFDNGEYYVSEEWANAHPKIHTNDLLIVQTGDIGQVALVDNEFNNCNCHALIIMTPKTEIVLPLFLTYYLRSTVGKELMLQTKTGALLPHLNSGKVKFTKVVVPLSVEQKEITNYLDKKCASIETIISKKEQLISELESYKKSLIYEYVTGKKEVPGYGN